MREIVSPSLLPKLELRPLHYYYLLRPDGVMDSRRLLHWCLLEPWRAYKCAAHLFAVFVILAAVSTMWFLLFSGVYGFDNIYTSVLFWGMVTGWPLTVTEMFIMRKASDRYAALVRKVLIADGYALADA